MNEETNDLAMFCLTGNEHKISNELCYSIVYFRV